MQPRMSNHQNWGKRWTMACQYDGRRTLRSLRQALMAAEARECEVSISRLNVEPRRHTGSVARSTLRS